MLEKIILEEKEIEQETIDRLLNLIKVLNGNESDLEKESNGKSNILGIAEINLAKSKLILDLVNNISDLVQGGK